MQGIVGEAWATLHDIEEFEIVNRSQLTQYGMMGNRNYTGILLVLQKSCSKLSILNYLAPRYNSA